MPIQKYTTADSWQPLKQFTAARIALGSVGVAIPLRELLQFRLAHAHARDAVYAPLNEHVLTEGVQQLQLVFYLLHSKAPQREQYLQYPQHGRQLNAASADQLKQVDSPRHIALVIADGLSATAVNAHAVPLLQLLVPLLMRSGFSLAPVSIVRQARVAVGDEIGALLKATCTVMLIGERPGLSSPDSMGVYLTYAPSVGLTDESRNCVSNIRPEGMSYAPAAEKIHYLITTAFRLQYSGVALKDNGRLLEDW